MNDFIELDVAYSTLRRAHKLMPNAAGEDLSTTHKSEHHFKSILFQPEGEGRKGEGGLRTKGYFKKSSHEKPLITVITVVFNGRAHLEEAIVSVIGQTYDNVEYIVIDGGSTDGSLDIIQKYDDVIDYWVCERDHGIYNAMNKGIILAAGEIIGLVNADDAIYLNTLESIAKALPSKSQAGFTIAPVELAHSDGKVYGITRPLAEDQFAARMLKEMPSPHQGVYVRKEIYQKLGLFNEQYRLSADYEFLLRMLFANIVHTYLDQPVGFFREGGKSGGISTWQENRKLHLNYSRSRLEIEATFISSIIKSIGVHILPRFLFKQLKALNTKSKHRLY